MELIRSGDLTVVRFVNSIYSSNSYLLCCDGISDAWLIDCGDVNVILEYAIHNNLCIRGVFLTHAHYDHIYGLNELLDKVQDVRIYTSDKGVQNLENPKFNMSRYHGVEYMVKSNNVDTIKNEDVFELFPCKYFKCISTPGHDWSCMTFDIGSFIFTGDSYIPGLKTVTKFPKGDRVQASTSEDIIKSMINENVVICPGHGDCLRNG